MGTTLLVIMLIGSARSQAPITLEVGPASDTIAQDLEPPMFVPDGFDLEARPSGELILSVSADYRQVTFGPGERLVRRICFFNGRCATMSEILAAFPKR